MKRLYLEHNNYDCRQHYRILDAELTRYMLFKKGDKITSLSNPWPRDNYFIGSYGGRHPKDGILPNWFVVDDETNKKLDEIEQQIKDLTKKKDSIIKHNRKKFQPLTVDNFNFFKEKQKVR